MSENAENAEKKPWLIRFLDWLLPHKVIVNCDRDPFLRRWYLLRTAPVAIFIHQFIRSDEDRALHDHPWAFLVIPIWRGYIEHSDYTTTDDDLGNPVEVREPMERRVYPILGTRFRPATYRHRVELLRDMRTASSRVLHPKITAHTYKAVESPAWSIFIRFREVRDWGFWPASGFIQWNRWWQDKCE